MKLNEKQRKHLRGLGHALKPVIYIGDAGLSDAVMKEYRTALEFHELIKVKVRVGDRQKREQIVEQLGQVGGAAVVQRVGNTALVYRHNPERNRIKLPSSGA